MKEALEDVKAAEQEARNILDEADKEAKAIVTEAANEGTSRGQSSRNS